MAVIDIGSNAIRLSFGHRGLINEDQVMRFPLRLGQDSFQKGQISISTSNKLMAVILSLIHI